MPPKPGTVRVTGDPNLLFSQELKGEIPPSSQTLECLYDLATKIYIAKPWTLLEESALILTSDPATGETCYCGATGELGESLAVRAYVGAESYRLLRGFAEDDSVGGDEFITGQYSVGVEFVHRPELEAPDKRLLNVLKHSARAKIFPIFRVVRPGYQPWFITEQEGQLLAACLRAVLLVCEKLDAQPELNYWRGKDAFPMVVRAGEEEGRPACRIETVKAPLPEKPSPAGIQVAAQDLEWLRSGKFRRGGGIEADCFLSGMAIGGKHERKAWARLAMAADAETGMLFAPEITSAPTTAQDTLAAVVLKAMKSSQALPTEVRVLSREFKLALQPISDACGLPVKVVRNLPNLAEGKRGLTNMLGIGFPDF